MDFKSKVALITSAATSGLGRILAEQLLGLGAKVAICGLDSDAGELTADEFSQRFGGDNVIFCHCDVTEGTEFEGETDRRHYDVVLLYSAAELHLR